MEGERGSPPGGDAPDAASAEALPFPSSLCHRCAAPPQYIRTARSTFIRCPIFKKYPPQPVVGCEAFVPAADSNLRPPSS
jgi:hypothetical protein